MLQQQQLRRRHVWISFTIFLNLLLFVVVVVVVVVVVLVEKA